MAPEVSDPAPRRSKEGPSLGMLGGGAKKPSTKMPSCTTVAGRTEARLTSGFRGFLKLGNHMHSISVYRSYISIYIYRYRYRYRYVYTYLFACLYMYLPNTFVDTPHVFERMCMYVIDMIVCMYSTFHV